MTEPEDRFQTIEHFDEEPTISLEPGKMLAGRYELVKQIGRGGMGVVWSAEEKIAERKVVLKFVPREIKQFEEAVAQLKASFKKIHELQHPHICPVYTLENDLTLGYYHVMKWLDGETLDQYIVRTVGRQQPLPFEEALRILYPVAEALDYAHNNRIIHRDIKPSNIFIVLDDEQKIRDVQVIDFGLASEIRSSLTRVSQMKFDTSGTRPYMAPEQWRGRPQTGQTDQYALATVAYELLAGYLPFDGDDFQILGNAILNFTPEPINGLSDHSNAALMKALEKDGGNRFTNCADFIAALGGAEFSREKKATPYRDDERRNDVQRNDRTLDPGVKSLMTRGHLALEDSDWDRAIKFFDDVLNIDAQCAPAYIGLLCAELKVPSEESLGDYEKPIADFGNFKKAVRFADDDYRTKIEGYDEKIRERLRHEQYDGLVQRKNKATEQQCLLLAEEFRAMSGYKDTIALAGECEKQYHALKEQREEQERQTQYDRLIAEKNRASEKDFPDLAKKFRAMDGYKDTAALADECDEQYRVLKEQREEQERIERERRQREKEERERREAEERERIRQERERREEEERIERYERLVQAKDKASTEDEYQVLTNQFREMKGYKDTAELANECDQLALKFRYKRICEATKTASTEEDWQRLAEQFRKMNGYKNTAKLSEECDKRADAIKEKERERIARPWQNPAKAGERQVLSIKSVDYAFRWCPSGTFTMGSPAKKGFLTSGEAERNDDETQHQVTLTRGFWMLETPVTQAMWQDVMGSDPSRFDGAKLPVEQVSWDDCQGFIQQLNGLTIAPSGYRFSLPTEAQWEYACRAGTTTPFNFGSVLNGDKANCNGHHPYGTSTKGKYLKKTSEVGSYPANAWGLFDMHGNVWEWCLDWRGDYPSGSVADPVGPSSGSYRVLRGGGWTVSGRLCRSAHRLSYAPSNRSGPIGVRISLVRVE